MRRFWAVFKKEFRQIARDRLSLGLLIFVPGLLLVLYGYALSFDVKHIQMAVLDEDQTRFSRELLDSLFQNPYFDRKLTLLRRAAADRVLLRGQAKAVLVVPRGYMEKVMRGELAEVQVLVDGSDATTGTTVVGYLDALTDRATRRLRGLTFASQGGEWIGPSLRIEPRVWFNPELESSHFLVPGLIAMLMMLSAVIATSLSIVREKERQTMEQIMVSPVQPLELILGKTVPYVVICLVTMLMILAMGYGLFGITIVGAYWLLALATLLFLLAALGMGVFISTITRSQQMAFQLATLSSLLPSVMLSGLIFPIKSMPVIHQFLTIVFIPRHFVSALRGIILKGAGLADVWPSLLAMLVLGILFIALAVVRTRKAI
jgi:ABC-2 type transport system permease protein